MRRSKLALMLLLIASFVCGSTAASAAGKKVKGGTKVIELTPEDLKWREGPPEIAPARMAVLEGNPHKKGFFVARLKVPAGTRIPAHFHNNVERVTVISGKVNLSMGEKRENPTVLPAGSYFSLPPRTVHNAWIDEETVLQIATNGPWSMELVKESGQPKTE